MGVTSVSLLCSPEGQGCRNTDMGSKLTVCRLDASHAAAIADCFRRVYAESYANELFYDVASLTREIEQGRLQSVGAVDEEGLVVGHMAMVCHPSAVFAELGNTVVDPAARGEGVAWQVGKALTAWCMEKGYTGYLHYPTTDHHIMQRRSVETGFETGLMLSYIPAETDGQVNVDKPSLRGASTIVFNPLGECEAQTLFCPERYLALMRELAEAANLERQWRVSSGPTNDATQATSVPMVKRGLVRLEVERVGADIGTVLQGLCGRDEPCLQLDFSLADANVEAGVEAARDAGFVFCGWLPGYRSSDVLRMQRFDLALTDLQPMVINPQACALLALCQDELTAGSDKPI